MTIRVGSDASAGIAMASRRGLGKTKHIQAQYLWAQGAVAERGLTLHKISTEANRADLMTKHLPAARTKKLLAAMGYEFIEGKSRATLSAW